MQSHRGLAGARTALHDEALLQRRADDLVLLRLDRRDDVAHLAGAATLELREQRVGNAPTTTRALGVRVGEVLVEEPDDLATIEREPAPLVDPHRVGPRRPVERHGDVGAPVHDDRVAPGILDVAPPDVEAITPFFVQATEGERDRRVSQRRQTAFQLLEQQGRVRTGFLPGPDRPELDIARGSGAHRLQAGVRVVEIGLFGRDFRRDLGHGRAASPRASPGPGGLLSQSWHEKAHNFTVLTVRSHLGLRLAVESGCVEVADRHRTGTGPVPLGPTLRPDHRRDE